MRNCIDHPQYTRLRLSRDLAYIDITCKPSISAISQLGTLTSYTLGTQTYLALHLLDKLVTDLGYLNQLIGANDVFSAIFGVLRG